MANKKINELTGKTSILKDTDLLMVYDMEESGSEKTKKVAISDYISIISEDLTLNVATTGNDTTGDGSAGAPFATINGAIDWMKNKTGNNDVVVTIKLADGTYNNQVGIDIRGLKTRLIIEGNRTNPENVILNYATGENGIIFYGSAVSETYVRGFTMNGYDSAEWQFGVAAYHSSTIVIQELVVDGFGNNIFSAYNSMVTVSDGTVSKNGMNGVVAQNFGILWGDGITLSNNTNNGAAAQLLGKVGLDNTSFTGNGNNTWTATGGTVNVY